MITSTVYLLILSLAAAAVHAGKVQNITAVFSFGDSILDAGNNNGILSIAQANHHPYGIDFPGGIPTGRFSDGKLATDIIAGHLGIKEAVRAYLDPTLTDKDLLTGVSFASAGSGLDGIVTPKIGNVMSMDKQLKMFEQAIGRMKRAVSEREMNRTLENALFIISAGSNDMMINKYILPLRTALTVPQYQDILVQKMDRFIRSITNMGGRKVVVLGIPPLGCVPLMMSIHNIKRFRPLSNLTCVEQYNTDTQGFNAKIQALLSSLPAWLPPGAKLSYVDAYSFALDMMKNPAAHGFVRSDIGCCGKGTLEIGLLCNKNSKICPNPTKYMFWDSVHPSQIVYARLADVFIKNYLPKLL